MYDPLGNLGSVFPIFPTREKKGPPETAYVSSLCLELWHSEHHAALPRANPLAVNLQEQNEENGGSGDACLNTEGLLCAEARHPRDLDVRGHETGPVSGGSDPGRDLAGALGVAVEQVGVDGGGDDHDADTLQRREHRQHHVVPQVAQPEAQDD